MHARARATSGEDAEAAVRAIFALTAAVGGVASAMAWATGELPLIAISTLLLLGCVLVGASVPHVAYAGAGVWLVLVPMASGEALLAPMAMVVVCLAIALGPERLLSWLARDAAPERGRSAGEGWIEEMPRRIG